MSNMAHCRFENTFRDLEDCYSALGEAGSIKEVIKNANKYEKIYVRRLIDLCKDIVDEFGEEIVDDH